MLLPIRYNTCNIVLLITSKCLILDYLEEIFSAKSFDKATLNQLKHSIHCTAVGHDPKDNMKVTEDFSYVVLCGLIVTAAQGSRGKIAYQLYTR